MRATKKITADTSEKCAAGFSLGSIPLGPSHSKFLRGFARPIRMTDSRFTRQSQRDCVLQPKVARHELPWGKVRK